MHHHCLCTVPIYLIYFRYPHPVQCLAEALSIKVWQDLLERVWNDILYMLMSQFYSLFSSCIVQQKCLELHCQWWTEFTGLAYQFGINLKRVLEQSTSTKLCAASCVFATAIVCCYSKFSMPCLHTLMWKRISSDSDYEQSSKCRWLDTCVLQTALASVHCTC